MLNEKELEFLGILRFHKAGFTGRNVVIASKENVIENIFNDVEAIEYENDYKTFSVHGTNVMDYIRQVVPDARKITAEFNGKSDGKNLYSESNDFIQRIVPDILTTSEWGKADTLEPKSKEYKKLFDKGCFLCCSAGNSGSKGTIKLCEGDLWKAIGAAKYNKGNPILETYSGISEELDFVSFDNLIATWDNKKHTGTSFSSPLFASMVALAQDFFISKTGKKLTYNKLMQFIKDNCVDLGSLGKDDEYGYGLFILPDPNTIDIQKYGEMITIEEVFEYLKLEGELLEPDYWKNKIKEEDKLKWLFIKWANSVRASRGFCEKDFKIINNYKIDEVISKLSELNLLLEPDYWKIKIRQEDKIKWFFFKWYYAVTRRL